MKKCFALLLGMIMIISCVATALAYGTTTVESGGVTYTVTDAYKKTTTSGMVGGTASCTVSPTKNHYSTSDVRLNNRNGKVIATSGRCWSGENSKSEATCTTTAANNRLGYGWWGGVS